MFYMLFLWCFYISILLCEILRVLRCMVYMSGLGKIVVWLMWCGVVCLVLLLFSWVWFYWYVCFYVVVFCFFLYIFYMRMVLDVFDIEIRLGWFWGYVLFDWFFGWKILSFFFNMFEIFDLNLFERLVEFFVIFWERYLCWDDV